MEVRNNKKEFQFEAELENGDKGTLTYRWLKGNMVLMHTFVPPSGRGTGIGSLLVVQAMEHARAHHLKVIVYCPFAKKYLESHPEYDELIEQPPTH